MLDRSMCTDRPLPLNHTGTALKKCCGSRLSQTLLRLSFACSGWPRGTRPRSRSAARKDRAVAISMSALARSPGVARAEVAPARSFGAIPGRAATYRPLDAPLVISPPPRSVPRGCDAHAAAAWLRYTIVDNAVE